MILCDALSLPFARRPRGRGPPIVSSSECFGVSSGPETRRSRIAHLAPGRGADTSVRTQTDLTSMIYPHTSHGWARHNTMRAVHPRTPLSQADARCSARVFARGARVSASTATRGIGRLASTFRSDPAASDASASDATPAEARAYAETSATARLGAVAGALAALLSLEPLAVGSPQALGLASAAGLASALAAAPAEAALSNPNTRLPRNGVAALRRAVPAINEDAGIVQSKLEEAAYLLRIPQRKPWGTMGDNVKTSLAVVRDRKDRLLEPVPAGAASAAAEETRAELEQLLVELTDIAGSQDVERFDRGVAMALDATSRLRVYQAPGLPFDVPRKYDALPRLNGRAVVDLTVRKPAGSSFGFVNGDETDTATLRVVVDGYNAPITAGNFVENVRRGVYNGTSLKKSETALLAPPREGKADPSLTLPLEVKPLEDYEPRYRSPLNVMGAEELPTLPLSVNGSLAMARGAEDGTSSASQFFIYQFDKRSAGLGGLAFEEGEFSVFGYVVQGEEEGFLSQLGTGDTIVRAKVVQGEEKLVNGGKEAEPDDAAAMAEPVPE